LNPPVTEWNGAMPPSSAGGSSPAEGLERRALLNRLDVVAQLTVLHAPPGYGKTTLIRRWAAERLRRGDRVRIWSTGRVGAEELATFVAASEDQRVIAVIDSFDAAAEAALGAALTELLLAHPRLRIVICTRTPVALQSLAWQNGLETSLIERSHLAASSTELAEMAATWHHELSVERAVELEELTGGWPRVARFVLDGTPPDRPFQLDLAARYVDATVLSGLSAVEREVATALSLAYRVTPTHIGAVMTELALDTAEVERILAVLHTADILQSEHEDAGMLPVVQRALVLRTDSVSDRERQWHEVFASALDRRGRDEELPELLRHARAALRWDLLGDAWQTHGNTLVDRFADVVVPAYSDIPADVRARLPYLTVPMSVAQSISAGKSYGDVQRVLYESLRPVAVSFMAGDEMSMDAETWLSGGAAAIVTHRLDADFGGALAIARRRDAHPRRDLLQSEAPMRYAWFLMQEAMTLLAAADGKAAYRAFGQSYAAAHDVATARFIAANSASNLALLSAFNGDTREARVWLTRYAYFAEEDRWTQGHVSAGAELTRAILALDELDSDRVRRHLAAVGDGTDIELWPFVAYARTAYALLFGSPVGELADLENLCTVHADHANAGGLAELLTERLRVDLLLSTGHLNQAAAILRARARGTDWWLETPRGRLHLIADEPAKTRQLANASGSHRSSQRDRLDQALLRAVAAELMGLADEADEIFGTAVALAERIGTLKHYLLVPERVLAALLGRSGRHELAERISALRPPGRVVFPEAALLVKLSPRETVVLESMARMDSFSQIASALSVSINTVKKQAASIYAKLGVHDRGAAILAARRLGMLPKSR